MRIKGSVSVSKNGSKTKSNRGEGGEVVRPSLLSIREMQSSRLLVGN